MTAHVADNEMCVVRRVVHVPPAAVFRVWTEPRFARQWSWGRQHDTVSVEIDCRVGGLWRQTIRNRELDEVWTFDGEFREVVPARRLVHTFHWRSDKGVDHGTSLVAIDFLAHAEGTEIVITHTQLRDVEVRDGTERGWERVLADVAEVAETADLEHLT